MSKTTEEGSGTTLSLSPHPAANSFTWPEYPFTPHTFVRPHGQMSYLDEGTGDPVVMLHGNPTWSFYYRKLVFALRDTHRCIAPDHIGCGLSDKPPEADYDYALKSRIDDLEALLDNLNLRENLTLVLHDWGGMIGMAFAARHPERVKRIIASNTAAFRMPPTKRLPFSLWLGRNTRLGAWLILKKNAFCRLATRWAVMRRPLPPQVRAMYLKPYDSPAHRVAVLKFVQTIPLRPSDSGYDIVWETELARSHFRETPLLLLWGMKDFVFDRDFLATWQQNYPHAEVQTWPDCGHYLLEDATDEVIMRVREFLAKHPITT